MIGIYQIKNKINGKSYIGKSVNIEKRWAQHKQHAPTLLQKAFFKYGYINFEFIVLEECTFEKLDEREIFWIAKLKPEYNLTKGGDGGDTFSMQSEEKKTIIRENKSKALKGNSGRKKGDIPWNKGVIGTFNHTEEYKQQLSEKMKGEGNPFYNKKHSEKTINNLKQIQAQFNWYNNGKTSIRAKECPDGFIPGRLISENDKERLRTATKGMHWWTNGIENILSLECPEGFTKGRIIKQF